jgi:heme/copper-type cytochrome/quinol oxidase subunit 3
MASDTGLQHAPAEGHEQEHAGNFNVPNERMAMWAFIGSECLFFGTLLATYMVYKGASLTGPYPQDILDIPLTTLSTFVLLMSSLAMVLALNAVQKDNRRGALFWLMMTVGMGCIFLGFQAYEFTHSYHEGLTLQSNIFGTTFFILTGFHGAHVSIGVIWLLILWLQTYAGRIKSKDALKVEIAGLYWHFVDIVWIVIFMLVYLLQE